MKGPWSLVKAGAGGLFKAAKFITTPVWMPAKAALGFVKEHKVLTMTAAVGALAVVPTVKKMNHPGQTVDVGCEHIDTGGSSFDAPEL